MKWLLPAALLLSCGPARTMNYHCPISLTSMTIHSEFEIDCTVAEQNVRTAQRLLWEHGLESPREFEDLYRNMNVYVYDEDFLSFDLRGDYYVVGQYTIGNGIETSKDGLAMLHEMLHHLDAVYLQIGTTWHENWDKNGYSDADYEYWQTAIAYRKSNTIWSR